MTRAANSSIAKGFETSEQSLSHVGQRKDFAAIQGGKLESPHSKVTIAAGVHFDDAAAQRNSRGRNMSTDILSTLYVAAGVIGNVAYVPTIRDLWQLKPATNLYSYLLWSGTSAVVFAYAAAVNCDRLFVTLSELTLVLCVCVVLLEFRRKRIVAGSREEGVAASGDWGKTAIFRIGNQHPHRFDTGQRPMCVCYGYRRPFPIDA